MSNPRAKRPSPALVISILALFVALGGSAYAATKLGTKNIKNNAITAAKIKKEAVTSAKIKAGAVTGSKIVTSSLGTVPSATSATNAVNATNATNATNAVNATNFSRYFTTGLVKATPGQTVTLAAVGPFTIVGQCKDEGAGKYRAATFVRTTEPHSFSYSHSNSHQKGNLEPGEEAELGIFAIGTEWDGENSQSEWAAAAANGSLLLQGFANNGVHVFGAACAFNLNWTSNG
jgi:hypothetical protein